MPSAVIEQERTTSQSQGKAAIYNWLILAHLLFLHANVYVTWLSHQKVILMVILYCHFSVNILEAENVTMKNITSFYFFTFKQYKHQQ